jgi:hypothetical protein
MQKHFLLQSINLRNSLKIALTRKNTSKKFTSHKSYEELATPWGAILTRKSSFHLHIDSIYATLKNP